MVGQLNKITGFVLLSTASAVFAGNMGDVASPAGRFNLGIEGGYSISTQTDFSPDASQVVTGTTGVLLTPTNTEWYRDFGDSGLVGVFAGYQYNQNFGLQLGYRYRGGYDWRVNGFDAVQTTYNLFTINKLSVQTVLLDLRLTPSSFGDNAVVPYAQAGIGYAYNSLGAMSQTMFDSTGQQVATAAFAGASTNNFAWDIGAGVAYNWTSNLSLRLGYTFTDVGSVKQAGTQTISGVVTPIVPFTSDHLFLNEVVAGLSFML